MKVVDCKCLNELETKIYEKFNADAETVEFDGIQISGLSFERATSQPFSYKVEGRKHSLSMSHAFCPFCGKEYREA